MKSFGQIQNNPTNTKKEIQLKSLFKKVTKPYSNLAGKEARIKPKVRILSPNINKEYSRGLQEYFN